MKIDACARCGDESLVMNNLGDWLCCTHWEEYKADVARDGYTAEQLSRLDAIIERKYGHTRRRAGAPAVGSQITHDSYCASCIEANPHAIVSWWMMATWAYDRTPSPIISDRLYDTLCADLRERWDDIDHPHKHFLDPHALKGRLGFTGGDDDWPKMVVGAAQCLQRETTPLPPLAKAA